MGQTVDIIIGNNTHDKLQRPTDHVMWKCFPFEISLISDSGVSPLSFNQDHLAVFGGGLGSLSDHLGVVVATFQSSRWPHGGT